MMYIAFQHLMISLYTWTMYQSNTAFEMQHNVNTESMQNEA